jgi:hypothetical protein
VAAPGLKRTGEIDPCISPPILYSTYNDSDFRLGLKAAQTTLAAIAALAEMTVK